MDKDLENELKEFVKMLRAYGMYDAADQMEFIIKRHRAETPAEIKGDLYSG